MSLNPASFLSFTGFVQDVPWQCKLRGGRSFCLHLGLLQFNFHLGHPHHTVLYQSGVLVAVLCRAVGLPVRSGWPLVRYVITQVLVSLFPPPAPSTE